MPNGEVLLILDKIKLARANETIDFINYGEAFVKLLDEKI